MQKVENIDETPAFAKQPAVPSSEVDLFGCSKIKKETFTESYIIPPFSILDMKQSYWQKRKKIWKNIIKENGEARFGCLANRKNGWNDINILFQVSLLDPVLCEIVLRWFSFENCKTFDPFAGDTIFGYVSSFLGNEFTGIELRQEQVDFNSEMVKGLNARYICDDAINVCSHIEEKSKDFLFSCPPYFDLEKYSQLPNDASNQKEYKDFLNILNIAFSKSIKCLKENRFACIVIGDVRDKKGYYRRLPHHICDIFEASGMKLINELILCEPIGRKAMTANRNFIGRKIPKVHQNILIFYKGDEKKIKEIFKNLR